MRIDEFIDIQKPREIKSKTVTKSGVQGATYKVHQRQFETQSGNDVKVMFENRGDGIFEVYFYVNDTMKDRSTRDPEILPFVLYIIKHFSNRKVVRELTFRAIDSVNDTKLVTGMDMGAGIKALHNTMEKLVKYLNDHPKREVEPTQKQIALYSKIGRELPVMYNMANYDEVMADANKILSSSEYEDIVEPMYRLDQVYHKITDNQKLNDEIKDQMAQYRTVYQSNQGGVRKTRNRRRVVYSKIVRRLFNEWHIEESGNRFRLVKK